MSTQQPLAGRVALVAGATRGAGRATAVELGRAGATVYATGRTTRDHVSEVGRASETIEETAELVTAAGGTGIAVAVDHLVPEQVAGLVDRIDREQGRLDVLVNDIWGGDHLVGWDKRLWQHDLADGLRALRLGVETHLVTSHHALPLLVREPGGLVVEVTDGTKEYNGSRYRDPMFYDLAKVAPQRIAFGLNQELKEFGGTAVCVTPGWLRSEAMLDTHFRVTEENWRDGARTNPDFLISETPVYLARGLARLAADPEVRRFGGRCLSSADLAGEYGVTDVDGSTPDAWRFLEDRAEGREVDPADYR
ncbi:SDR family oxidoreductase [Streptomyces alkaliterrae]|uniref:SDR family NAD(P)-dependent oxidoreductase n=1 Tax=Streptomyces alkaliterrae TaxID=2213162 RepID=A0A5P0YUR6_9ACTN|nr:SDR family oxidoreductase [Streptomyces alkaliterrae]MBB1255293.1 SDR family oxidoreductase [Streptomyces alkaliterrae]MBB1260519.1 SDR family oxidoreductase [Streptomyces alkaliterrae]MQS04036.1 SDR family NAD(P)-dependent oxidoreductase [Streptomyces alkaliterrae]